MNPQEAVLEEKIVKDKTKGKDEGDDAGRDSDSSSSSTARTLPSQKRMAKNTLAVCETREVLLQSKRIRLSSVVDQGDDAEAQMMQAHAQVSRRDHGSRSQQNNCWRSNFALWTREVSCSQTLRFTLPTARDYRGLCECVPGPLKAMAHSRLCWCLARRTLSSGQHACWHSERLFFFCSRYPAGRPGEVSSVQGRIVSMAALEAYFETFKALCAGFSDC